MLSIYNKIKKEWNKRRTQEQEEGIKNYSSQVFLQIFLSLCFLCVFYVVFFILKETEYLFIDQNAAAVVALAIAEAIIIIIIIIVEIN